MPRSGRRPGPSTTRAAILDAARRRFAELGFRATSIRAIAADAHVDPAVVMHFFGSKDGLFRAAVGWPFDPAPLADLLAAPGPGSLGNRLARTFLATWQDQPQLAALLRSAMTDAAAATLVREFVTHQLFARVVDHVHAPDATLRVDLAAAHLLGVAILRHILHIEPIASADLEDLVARVTPALDGYLSAPSDERLS